MPTGTPIFSPACLCLRRSSTAVTPAVFSVRLRTCISYPLARPTSWGSLRRACRFGWAVALPSSGVGGLPLSPHDFQDFRKHGLRMGVDDLDARSGELVGRAPLHVALRGPNCFSGKRHVPAIPSPLPCLQSLLHLCELQPMARTSANTPFPLSLRLHDMTTMHCSLVR